VAHTNKKGPAVFNEVERMSLAHRAAASMREAILSGELLPGAQIVEADIADQMKISRAPVREAIRVLEEEGLVRRVPYKGSFVTRISKRDILELYSLRSVIETFATRLAAQNATPEDLEKLRDIFTQMRQAAKKNDNNTVTDLDLLFHRTVCETARHELLFQWWSGMEQKIRLILAMRHRLHREISEVVDRHRPLLEALESKDSELAAQRMTEHIVASGELFMRYWQASDLAANSGEPL